MDVYLVPIGPDRYELYCEVPDEPEEPIEEAPAGFVKRMKQRFSAVLAEAERERHRSHTEQPRGALARAKAYTLRYVAENIAEQRLLWHLRRQEAACLFFPDDLDDRRATTLLRRQLGRDFEKHRFWLIVDSVGFVASGALVLLPGPNIVAYYFAFRMVGHYLSLRRRAQGPRKPSRGRASRARRCRSSAGLSASTADERERRVHDVANALKLEHLVKFFERTAIAP